MSAVFVVVPVVMAYPVLLSAAAAVASASGFVLVEQTARSMTKIMEDAETCEELEIESREELVKILEVEGGFTLEKGDIKLAFTKSRESGKIKMLITASKRHTKEELHKLGQEVINDIIQRYAYDRLINELKKEGFNVVNENVEEDKTIRLRVRKW